MAEHSFEKDLKKLEQIVAALEEGGLSLDESLKRFEEGVKLSQRCEKALTEAEKKIEVLVKNAEGKLEPQPFGETEETPEGEGPDPRKPPPPKRRLSDEEDDDKLLF